ncbi:MAG TPA: glycosyltransferase, partial [Burkholderiales bacterium]
MSPWTPFRRRFDFRIEPCPSLEPMDAAGMAWRARDEAPWFDLVPVGGAFPSGWVLIECRLLRRASDFTATLHYDTGGGFDAARAIRPPVTRRGVLLEIVRLPPGIRAMRWQPMQSPGVFEQSPLVMTEIGWVERIARMWRRVVPLFFLHPRAKLEKVGLTPRRALCGLRGAYEASGRLRAYAPALSYPRWVEQFDTLSDRDRELIRAHVGRLERRPLISILMPARDAPEDLLRRAVESVRAQLYPHWELCVAGDASTDPRVLRLLEDHAAADARIRLGVRKTQVQFALACNLTLSVATGDYIAFLESDALLAEHALYMAAVEINEHPELSAVFSDEDMVDAGGRRFGAYHKPDWNPELFRAQNLVGRLAVYRASLVREAGGLRSGFEGGEDYDLALRIAERVPGDTIRHVPMVLYHARAWEGPQTRERTPGAWDAGRRALEEHLTRLGVEAAVGPVPGTPYYRVRYALPARGPLVSIVIPTRDRCDLLRVCLESIFERTRYGNFEVVVVDNASSDPAALEYLERLSRRERVTLLRHDHPFNYSAINNLGVRHARGTVLCLLNNDTEVITPDWLEAMLGHLLQPG